MRGHCAAGRRHAGCWSRTGLRWIADRLRHRSGALGTHSVGRRRRRRGCDTRGGVGACGLFSKLAGRLALRPSGKEEEDRAQEEHDADQREPRRSSRLVGLERVIVVVVVVVFPEIGV